MPYRRERGGGGVTWFTLFLILMNVMISFPPNNSHVYSMNRLRRVRMEAQTTYEYDSWLCDGERETDRIQQGTLLLRQKCCLLYNAMDTVCLEELIEVCRLCEFCLIPHMKNYLWSYRA